MASRLAFHYFSGNSVLHRWDARCKFIGLALITFALLHMNEKTLLLSTVVLAGAVLTSRLPVKAVAKDLRGWLVLLIFIFLVQSAGTPDPDRTFLPWLPVNSSGMAEAAMICWRLSLMLGYGLLFTLVTKPGDLQNALIWFLQPFPFLPAQRIALMVTLTIRLLPLIMDQMDDVALATRSRLGTQRKDLLRRAKYLALPLFRRSLVRADELALALAARGYREDRPVVLPRIPLSHLLALMPLGLSVAVSSPLFFGFVQDILSAVSVQP